MFGFFFFFFCLLLVSGVGFPFEGLFVGLGWFECCVVVVCVWFCVIESRGFVSSLFRGSETRMENG